MMDHYYTHRRHGHNYMRDNETEIDPEGHATDLFTQWAIETVEQCAQDEDPFLLYLAYNAPHTPIQPPDEWLAKVRRREPEISDRRARYVALVEHMDAGIGRVREAIDTCGIASDTFVIYVSDNGGQVDAGASNGPLRGAKQQMYEGGIRVPCCACQPGTIPPGKVSDEPAMLMDLFPTACEIAGVEITHEIDGYSLLPTLKGHSQDFSSRCFYWVRREGGKWSNRTYLGNAYHGVRLGNLKLLHDDAFRPLELYDVNADPKETCDLASDRVADMNALSKHLQEQVQKGGGTPWQKRSGRTFDGDSLTSPQNCS